MSINSFRHNQVLKAQVMSIIIKFSYVKCNSHVCHSILSQSGNNSHGMVGNNQVHGTFPIFARITPNSPEVC